MPEVELFSFEACPYAQRTRMMMIEKDIEFCLTEVDLSNKPDWWKKLSPHGKVPLIRHNGGIVYESRIINEYIEEAFPQPPLLPRDALGRATARIWIDYCDTYLTPALHQLMANKNSEEKQILNRKNLGEKFLFLEFEGIRKLGDGPLMIGEDISLIDLQYMPFMERFPCYEELWGASLPDECTSLRKWMDAMRERESYNSTMNTVEYHMERYKRWGEAT
ncbi:MAG: glutathione S-transferase family protein [Rhodospirillaceae bacterium]